MPRCALWLVACAVLLLNGFCLAADWPQFRGPGGNAVAEATGLPTHWDANKNIVWKAELPGLGTSSPIVIGDRVYVTCYSGYAETTENPGDMNNLKRTVVCVERASGKIAWTKDFEPKLPESEYRAGNDGWHGYSSSTISSDGKNLFVFFGKSGVYCLDMEGNQVWRKSVGEDKTGWGSSNSPVLHKGLVIINASIESGRLVALDKKSGDIAWEVRGIRGCRNTPCLVTLADGKSELVINGTNRIQAFDPDNGDELWDCDGIPDNGYVCPSLIHHDGIVYSIGGRKNTAIAVRAGGRGDVTASHVLWRKDVGSNVASPVYVDGYLYWIHERQGTAMCLDAKTGKVEYQERLEPRPGIVYSSVTAADGKLFAVSQYNGVYVLAAKPKFELLAHNTMDDDSRANASPAVHNNQLLLRNDRNLYCIGAK